MEMSDSESIGRSSFDLDYSEDSDRNTAPQQVGGLSFMHEKGSLCLSPLPSPGPEMEDAALTTTEEITRESAEDDHTADTAPLDPMPETRKKKKSGRPCSETTTWLRCLRSLKSGKRARKDFLRMKTIRGFKHAICIAFEKGNTRKKAEKFTGKEGKSIERWKEFKKYVRRYKELRIIAQTENGPCTDGKAKRKSPPEDAEKSFNNKFCKQFFAASEVREAYSLFSSLTLASDDEAVLQAKLLVQPTSADQEERGQVWRDLREYLQHGILRELGLPSP